MGVQDEQKAAKADFETMFGRVAVIRKAIIDEHKATGKDAGHMACPACRTGFVNWSRARSNGHVWARCSTPDCASWME